MNNFVVETRVLRAISSKCVVSRNFLQANASAKVESRPSEIFPRELFLGMTAADVHAEESNSIRREDRGTPLCLMGLSVINLDEHMPAICVHELKKPFFCRDRMPN